MTRTLVAFMTVCLIAPVVFAQQDDSGFYERGGEGWFWYQDPEPEPEPEEKPKFNPKPVTPPEEKDQAETQTSKEEPEPMSVAWFQKHFKTIMNRAIDNPTEENVAAFFMVNDVMKEKSEKFARMGQLVAQKYPELDRQAQYPKGQRANQVREQKREKILQRVFDRLSEAEGGIWFFYGDDPYTPAMVESLRTISRDMDVDVYPFSVDGSDLSSTRAKEQFRGIRQDDGQSEAADVSYTPAAAFAVPPNEVYLIGHGSLSRGELEDRILRLAHRHNIISDDEMDLALGNTTHIPEVESNDFDEIDNLDSKEIIDAVRENSN